MVTPSTSFAQVVTAPARIPIQAVQAIGPEIKSIDVKELERELLPRLVDALKAVFALRKDSTEEVTSTKLTLDINRENKKRKDDQRTPLEEKGCIEGSQLSFSQQKDTNMVKKPRGWPKDQMGMLTQSSSSHSSNGNDAQISPSSEEIRFTTTSTTIEPLSDDLLQRTSADSRPNSSTSTSLIHETANDSNLPVGTDNTEVGEESSFPKRPLDLSVFKSLKGKWDIALSECQRHNEGRRIPKKEFSQLVGQVWSQGKGAEVIACIEHSNQTISTTKSLTENGNSESELSDPVYEDDDDGIEAEMREQEDLEKCVEEISKPIEDITSDDWIMVKFAGKKMLKYYVGLVVSTEDKLVELKFAKRIPSLNPHASTFTWADEENSFLL
ncbi:hypothetical protein RN001_000123 [Aquatica leii]|uniref:Uncharacterized protein n=1 Tax=Aquatica leii TaxID=1421715 RepID=A0AAN7Q6S8_9COLE|nr:hypothetical protein RN001_000123 [Aquatica leii]